MTHFTQNINIKKGELPSKTIRKKIGKEMEDEVKKVYKPYEKLSNAFKDCHQTKCKKEAKSLKKVLSKKKSMAAESMIKGL